VTEAVSEEKTLEARLLACVDGLSDDLVDLAARLVRVPSVTPKLMGEGEASSGEADVNALVAEAMRRYGLEVDLFETAPGRANAVGTLRGSGEGRSLALNGHVDTVPAGRLEAWARAPFSGAVEGGQLHGRGSTDMKGGVAAMVVAAGAVARVGARLAGDLVVQSVVGEETGDPEGTRAVLDRGHRADACINAEPSVDLRDGRRLTVQIASNPILLLRVTLRGRSTHAALRHEWLYPGGRPEIGVNALEKGVALVNALQRLEQTWAETKRHPLFPHGKFVLHPGYFHSGPSEGSGPYYPTEKCVVEYIVFHHPDETADQARAEIAAAISAWAGEDPWLRRNPPELEWLAEYPSFSTDPEHPLVAIVASAHERVTGERAAVTGFLAGSDATVLSRAGIPTVVYGAGEIAMAHAVDEHVDASELVQAAKVYAITAVRWCGLAT
jgi:acetylornithine deacetylase